MALSIVVTKKNTELTEAIGMFTVSEASMARAHWLREYASAREASYADLCLREFNRMSIECLDAQRELDMEKEAARIADDIEAKRLTGSADAV